MTRCLNNPAQLDNAQGKYPAAEPLVKRAKMKRRLEQIEESIDPYLSQLDRAHRVEPSVAEAKTVRLEDTIAATLRWPHFGMSRCRGSEPSSA